MFERLKRIFKSTFFKRAASPFSVAVQDFRTTPTQLEVNADALAERQDANIATACRLIGDSIANLPLQIMSKEIIDGKEQFVADDSHPAIALMSEPNYYHYWHEIILHMVQSLILGGNSYHQILKVNSETIELWPIESWLIDLLKDQYGRPIGYIYAKDRPEQRKFSLEEILHVRLYNNRSIFQGRSHIEPLRTQILESYYADRYNTAFFKNDATPGGLFTPDIPMTVDQAKEFKEAWEILSRGVDKAHGIRVSTMPGKFDVTSASHKDVAFLDLIKMARERCFGVIGIPPTMAGIMEFASYANALLEDRAFWQNTNIPFCALIEKALTRQLMHRYYDTEHIFKFDYSGVQALHEDALKESQAREIDIRAGYRTINEFREDKNLPPVDWGDEPPQSMNQFLPGDNPNENGGESNAGSNKALIAGRALPSPRLKLWKAKDKIRVGYEKRFEALTVKYFIGQRDRIIRNLHAATNEGRTMSLLFLHIKADTPDDPGDIFKTNEEKTIWRETAGPFIRKTIKESGQSALNEAGIETNFNITNPNVKVTIEKLLRRSEKMVDSTFDNIKEIMQTAYDEGWTLSDLEKEIRSTYRDYSQARSTMIARTEMGGAINGGTNMAYSQAGVEKKQWLAVQDNKTRDGHAAIDMHTVDINSRFAVVAPDGNTELLEYPGDPDGSPGNIINDRCTLIAVMEKD